MGLGDVKDNSASFNKAVDELAAITGQKPLVCRAKASVSNFKFREGMPIGIKVTLTPFISPQGYVTLNIKPEYSTVAGEVRTASEVTGTTDLVATLLSRRDLDLKNVRIKDGETLVIGGMIQETEQKTVNKIPFLGDLPLVGSIFRSTSTSKTKTELVIMITPKILNDSEGSIADSL